MRPIQSATSSRRVPTPEELQALSALIQHGRVEAVLGAVKGLCLATLERSRLGLMNLAVLAPDVGFAVSWLLEHGADVNARDVHGQTALHTAAQMGHVAAIDVLVRCGADVNSQDRKGNTPLHLAAKAHHVRSGIHLIESGAWRTVRNDEGALFLDGASAVFVQRIQAWIEIWVAMRQLDRLLENAEMLDEMACGD